MIKGLADYVVSVVSPARAVKRAHARKVERSFKGGESDRLDGRKTPRNESADSRARGPYGADAMRAWAREMVTDNEYAWAAKESVVSEVIGSGFKIQSALESNGQDDPDTNENRDKIWDEWCEVCDINGQMTFDEMQVLAFSEMFEAGEVLVHYVPVPLTFKGIRRRIPLAIELIEADRLASDHDTFLVRRNREQGTRTERGVEMDEHGMPLGYWIYPTHPDHAYAISRTPEYVPANRIKHLFRKDRIGMSRGNSWFSPSLKPIRSLGTYREYEMQSAAVESCFTVAIATESGQGMNMNAPTADTDTQDSDGNTYQFLQPGLVLPLKVGESLQSASPSRPNSNATGWITHMVQGIAAGTGTSYEAVSKDFSSTNYSSSRTAKLENRPRYRRWQKSWSHHFCLETWDRFCNAAASAGVEAFPTMVELLDDRRAFAPVEIMTPEWEWVDIQAEQQSNENAVAAHQKSETEVAGSRGINNRRLQRQIAKDKQLRQDLANEFGVDMRTAAEAKITAEVAKETTAEAATKTADAAMVTAEQPTNGQMAEA